jgi:hypothetical protein
MSDGGVEDVRPRQGTDGLGEKKVIEGDEADGAACPRQQLTARLPERQIKLSGPHQSQPGAAPVNQIQILEDTTIKITRGQNLIAAALVCVLVSTSAFAQGLPTTGTIETPIGKLEIKNGYPTDKTVTKLYDALDFERATQAYIWALPYMAMAEWQREQRETFGAGNLDYVDYLDFKDKLGILTANATTPYAITFPNLEKTGPLVFEIPAGALAGGIMDFWQRPLTDTGMIGPDKGQGGKFLILGPGHPDLKPEGYFVFRSATNNVWSGIRGLDPDKTKATALLSKLRIYPYDQRDNPTETKHLRPDGRKWTGEQPRGLAYWQGLAHLINEEPAIERDRIILAMLVPLGIEKSRPFNPDAPVHPDVFGQKWNLQFSITPVIPKLIERNLFGD